MNFDCTHIWFLFRCNVRAVLGGHDVATVAPVIFTSAGSESNVVSMPDISVSVGHEENQLLQNEVYTLTRDMHSVSERLQATQEGDA